MLLYVKILRSLFNAIAGSGNPSHVWFACVLGMLSAFAPMGLTEPLTWTIVALLLATRSGIGLWLTAHAICKLFAVAGGARLVEGTGVFLLERLGFLQGTWQALLNLPVIALYGLDRYVYLGAVAFAVVLGAALYVPITWGARVFKERYLDRLLQYRVVRWFRGFWLVKVVTVAGR